MRPLQKEIIDAALAGQHALGVLPTGAGKSLTYRLTARFLPMPTLVLFRSSRSCRTSKRSS